MHEVAPFTPMGQPAALRLIRRMVDSGHVGGSYLFTGPQGVGKMMAARFFAMAVNCLAEDAPPCGQCEACSKILQGTHPDLLFLAPEPNKQTISIDRVRQIQETLAFGPYEGKRRVVIINPAERLGLEAANALLLTLEAPPAHTFFILITATPYALLTTIRSRCQVIRFSPLSKKVLLEIAGRLGLSPPPTDPILEQCQGSVTNLLHLLSPEQDPLRREMETILTSLLTGSPARGLIETPKWAKQRAAMEDFLERALWVVRNVWIRLHGKGDHQLRYEYMGITEEKIAERLKPSASKQLLSLLETLLGATEDIKHNASPELVFDTLRIEMEMILG